MTDPVHIADLVDALDLGEPPAHDQQILKLGRPHPIRLDGCTCGGIGDTGAHHHGCPWGQR